MAVVLVGAANVGRMTLSFTDLVTNTGGAAGDFLPPQPVRLDRGDELGAFHLGSTVVLLAPILASRVPVRFPATSCAWGRRSGGRAEAGMVAAGSTLLVGVISDTHGLLRPEALRALEGCHHILHAGDVGAKAVLENLALVAPVTAVPGNVDTESWASDLPRHHGESSSSATASCSRTTRRACGPPCPTSPSWSRGTPTCPRCRMRRGVLDFNPGSAGPRRFRQPVSVGRLHITEEGIRGELVALDV